MARIFIIEDDPTIADLLKVALQHEGHEVRLEPRGDLAPLDEGYDLVLLDLTLPDVDGLDLARRIRGAYDLPIIMVTARGEVQDKVAGFSVGADDYVTKPFNFAELAARVRAVLKRAGSVVGRLQVGPLVLDAETRQAWWHERAFDLSPREFDLLTALMRRPGRVFTREELLDRVWGFDFEGESNVLEATIRRLRERLGDKEHRIIATVRGVGYTLRLP
ncbi:MAG: response regulator transcription factor [bacterium]|nr:response regulator transcription factor [bacterium]